MSLVESQMSLNSCFFLIKRSKKKSSHCILVSLKSFMLEQWISDTFNSFLYYLGFLCKKNFPWASLVAQWLRVCLPMQGTRVRALVWEDPTCRGATRPVSHNYWACASGACAPQQERPRQWEARALRWRVGPACRSQRKPSHRNEDPTQPKIK